MALGSRAFVGLARSVLHLMADPDDEKRKLLLPGKSNLSAPLPGLAFRIVGDPGRLEWEPDPLDGIRADDVVAPKESKEAKRGPEPTTRDAAAEWLAELLKDGPMPVVEIREQAKAADLSWGTIRRAQHSLGIVPRKMAFGSGWVWGLPEDAQVSSKMLKFPRRCSSFEKLEHLRENAGEKGQNCLDFAEDAQVSRNLSTFEKNLSTFEKNLSTFEETWPPSRITGTAGDAESDAPAGTADDAESDAPADPDLTRRFKLSTLSTVYGNAKFPKENSNTVDVDTVDDAEADTPATDGPSALFDDDASAGPYFDRF
jgi:hypothetical protein